MSRSRYEAKPDAKLLIDALDRVFGRPAQAIAVSAPDGGPVAVRHFVDHFHFPDGTTVIKERVPLPDGTTVVNRPRPH